MIDRWQRPEGVRLRLVLVRHGKPEAAATGRCYGKLDVGLSDEGRGQIRRLADAIPFGSFDAVVASPRTRAVESARLLSETVAVDPRLAEIDFGEIEGLTYEEVRKTRPALYRDWMERPTTVTFPGGESFSEMRERVLEAMRERRRVWTDASLLVVSHGGVNRILIADALGLPDELVFRLEQSYAGVSVVDYYADTPLVRLVNGVLAC